MQPKRTRFLSNFIKCVLLCLLIAALSGCGKKTPSETAHQYAIYYVDKNNKEDQVEYYESFTNPDQTNKMVQELILSLIHI